MCKKLIDSYQLSEIKVKITSGGDPQKYKVECYDGNYHAAFTVRKYEYKNYKRHMNQRIKNAFNNQQKKD